MSVRRSFAVAMTSLACLSRAFAADPPVIVEPPPPPAVSPPADLAPRPFTGGPAESPNRNPRNFEGVWVDKPTWMAANYSIGVALPDTPLVPQIVEHRQKMAAQATPVASPHLTCRPTGIDATLNPHLGVVVAQTSQEVVFVSEEDRNVRHILLNQRHPAKLVSSYMGHSIGHWEDNTLVVDTVGYNGLGWLDERGIPLSDQLHVVEHIRKSADGSELQFEVTITDPKYFTKPFMVKRRWAWASGVRLLDYDCNENPGAANVGMIYENEQFRPVCRMMTGEGGAQSRVRCENPRP
jgi:hypothetical protein